MNERDPARSGGLGWQRDPQVVAAPACHHGEGPVWDERSSVLHWLDLTAGVVHHLAVSDAWSHDLYGTEITAIAPHTAGGLIAATSDGFAHLSDGRLRPLSDVIAPLPELRMNDGGCDRAGRFLAGSMSYEAEPYAGTLYRLELDGDVSILLEGVTIPNGLDWSPDGSVLYFTDSARQQVTSFRYDQATGVLSCPQTFLDLTDVAGEPDGLTVDRDGNLWIAMWDGWQVRCHVPSGELLLELPLPVQRPTSVAFGGPSLRDLYVTTSQYGLSSEQLADQPAAGRLLRYRSTPTVGRAPTPRQACLPFPRSPKEPPRADHRH